MQWVVTTGRTVDEAKQRALDALGIDDLDAEFEVLTEASTSMLGLRRHEARVRARVRPTRPRPKVDRRSRRRKGGRRPSGRDEQGTGQRSASDDREGAAGRDADAGAGGASGPGGGRRRGGRRRRSSPPDRTGEPPAPVVAGDREAGEPSSTRTAPTQPTTPREPSRPSRTRGAPMSDIPLSEQEPTAVGFVEGLLEAFDAEAGVEVEHVDDDAIEIRVEGDDLGLLVGPRGATLSAIQELTRTAVAQQHSGRLEGRLRVDVAGYRARRKEALIRFAGQIADKVKASGSAVALEPMSPPDRKIVHDAINEIDGVRTSSEGEDRRRHVVIHPED